MIILTALFVGILAGFILGYLFRGVMTDSKTECCRPDHWSACFQRKDSDCGQDTYCVDGKFIQWYKIKG